MADPPAPTERRPPAFGHDAAAIRVREQDVVVLGQVAHGGRRVRIGERRVGEVEELAPVLVGEGPELRAQPLDDLAQSRQPTPGRHVGNARRAERGEVPQDDLVQRRIPRRGAGRATTRPWSAAPARSCPRRRAAAPGRARACNGTRARAPGVETGEPLGERRSQLLACEWLLGQRTRRRGQHRLEVDAVESGSGLPMAASSPSRIGCISGRRSRQSPAVTRWIVPRMTTIRTTSRARRCSARVSGSNPASRDQRAVYGSRGTCACRPTRCSTVSSTGRSERSRRSCRESVARLSARAERTSRAIGRLSLLLFSA